MLRTITREGLDLLRTSWFGVRNLHCGLGLTLPMVLVSWPIWVRVQEPQFFQTMGVPFFWPSMQACLYLAMACIPLLWCLALGTNALGLSRRLCRSPWRLVLHIWLSVCGYGGLLAALTLASCISVDRICGGAWQPELALTSIYGPLLFLASAAALTPALANLALPNSGILTLWLLVVAAMLSVLDLGSLAQQERHPEFFSSGYESKSISAIVCALSAIGAGLLISLATIMNRVRG